MLFQDGGPVDQVIPEPMTLEQRRDHLIEELETQWFLRGHDIRRHGRSGITLERLAELATEFAEVKRLILEAKWYAPLLRLLRVL